MKTNLVLCNIKPYTITLDTGKEIKVTNEKWFGYFIDNGDDDDNYFYATCYDYDNKNDAWTGGETLTVTKQKFCERVETFTNVL